jgi:tetratricopeptide (TPR) repeat protein
MKKTLNLLLLLILSNGLYSQTANEYYNRGVLKHDLEDYIGAISDFNKAIDINPNDDSAFFNRAVSKGKLKDYIGAIVDFSKAIEINPSKAKYYYYRGIGKLLLHQKNSGCLDLSKAGALGMDEAYDSIRKFCN